MIDIKMALEGLKGLEEIMPGQLKATNYEGMGELDAREFKETMELAIAALEKQIAKKPNAIKISFMPAHKCDCGYYIDDILIITFKFCPGCGQKLDWGIIGE